MKSTSSKTISQKMISCRLAGHMGKKYHAYFSSKLKTMKFWK